MIDRAGHDDSVRWHAAKSGFAIVRLVADQEHQAMALRGRLFERPVNQRLADAALAERGLDGERAEEERLVQIGRASGRERVLRLV